MQKNTAGKWVVMAFNETNNTRVTGDAANITANIRIDGGAANAVDDVNPTELEDGFYIFDITAVEANGDNLLLTAQSSTSNVQVVACPPAVWTRPPNFEALGIETDGDLTKVNTLHGHTAQTGDSFARLGAPAGADVSADVAAIKAETALIVADTNELQTDDVPGLIAALNNISTAQVNAEVDTALADIKLDHLVAVADADDAVNNSIVAKLASATGDWSTFVSSTDALEAISGASTPPTAAAIADAVWDEPKADHTTATSFGDLATDLDSVLADTNELQTDDVPGLIAALNDLASSDILTTALTESYAADGATMTLSQALYMIWSVLHDFDISSTTITAKKLDGTTAMTFTMDDATNPTSRTRAT